MSPAARCAPRAPRALAWPVPISHRVSGPWARQTKDRGADRRQPGHRACHRQAVLSQAGWRIITCSRDAVPAECKRDPNWSEHLSVDLSEAGEVENVSCGKRVRLLGDGGLTRAGQQRRGLAQDTVERTAWLSEWRPRRLARSLRAQFLHAVDAGPRLSPPPSTRAGARSSISLRLPDTRCIPLPARLIRHRRRRCPR